LPWVRIAITWVSATAAPRRTSKLFGSFAASASKIAAARSWSSRLALSISAAASLAVSADAASEAASPAASASPGARRGRIIGTPSA
jgi:hypothetical protein